jgi:starvation-inducible DNA-binding protein
MSALGDKLNDCLAEATVLYYRTHAAHWNVTGDDFPQFHEFFEDIYKDIWKSLDSYAENLRRLGEFPVSSIGEIASKAKGPNGVVNDDQALLKELIALNDGVIKCIGEAYHAAQAADEQGVSNFLADRDSMHKKWRWQMTASLESASDAAEPSDAKPEPAKPTMAPRKKNPALDAVAPVTVRPPAIKVGS